MYVLVDETGVSGILHDSWLSLPELATGRPSGVDLSPAPGRADEPQNLTRFTCTPHYDLTYTSL
jgi:hypothetical protein